LSTQGEQSLLPPETFQLQGIMHTGMGPRGGESGWLKVFWGFLGLVFAVPALEKTCPALEWIVMVCGGDELSPNL
jgi:hypothetical protein